MLLQVNLQFLCKQATRLQGLLPNPDKKQAVATGVIASQGIPDSSVELVGSTEQLVHTTSSQDSSAVNLTQLSEV